MHNLLIQIAVFIIAARKFTESVVMTCSLFLYIMRGESGSLYCFRLLRQLVAVEYSGTSFGKSLNLMWIFHIQYTSSAIRLLVENSCALSNARTAKSPSFRGSQLAMSANNAR